MLDVIHFGIVERGIVNQNLHRVRAPILDAPGGDVGQQIGQAAGLGIVVTAVLIGQEQTGVLAAFLRGGKAPLRIQQNRARVRRQHLGDGDLEVLKHLIGDGLLIDALGGCERLLKAAALIHGGGRDYALFVGEGFHVFPFSGRQTHKLYWLDYDMRRK